MHLRSASCVVLAVVVSIALQALGAEKNPSLIPIWRERVAKFPRGSHDWYLSVLGLLAAGQGEVIDECFAFLGTTDELDEALLSYGSQAGFARAVPLLRAYQRSGKASPKVHRAFTHGLLLLDYANSGNDEDALIASGTEEDLATVIGIDHLSAARLEKLFPLLAKTKGMNTNHDLQADLTDQLATGLFQLLEKSDAGGLELAERWSTPNAETQKLLGSAPTLVLVLGLWRQSRGELAAARGLFERGLNRPPAAPKEGGSYDTTAPQVGYAAILKHHACLLESTGQRASAVKELERVETWAEPVKHQLDTLLATFTFPSWSPEWCVDGTTAASLTSMPLVLAAKSSRAKENVLRINIEVRNASAKEVKVNACPASTGELPSETVLVSIGDRQLDVPLPKCTPAARRIAAGAKSRASFDVTLPANLEPGPLDVQLRPASKQQLHFLLGL